MVGNYVSFPLYLPEEYSPVPQSIQKVSHGSRRCNNNLLISHVKLVRLANREGASKKEHLLSWSATGCCAIHRHHFLLEEVLTDNFMSFHTQSYT
ncbi:hypothetical protein Y032_0545g3238 [Ancylostoma ceylanicum]|uniref:Uncharacterized protein n=1 Tax=Ancylostoma ceylanicum TaxID=53326 RepID=A0A016WQZ8_9BILA|nr:hypothetical protein Y032_0545g3238 [Ancylostoma ceylanicum]